MKNNGSHLPNFGMNYLQPGCSVIHFYYSPQEQVRFLPFVVEGLRLGQTAVLAAPPGLMPDLLESFSVPRFRKRACSFEQVELTPDLATCVPVLTRAVREAALATGVVRVLADFSTLVSGDEVFDIEATLSSSFRGLRLMSVTQYDGTAVSAPTTVEQFKTHSLAVVGDAFFYENRKHIPPEMYHRKRAAAAAAR